MTTVSTFRTLCGLLLAGAISLVPVTPAGAQAIKRTPTGFNLFTVEQDIELGRQSALEIDREVTLVASVRTEQFLSSVAALLAARAPGVKYPFRIKAVTSTGVNAFVLPGGPIYIHRDLLSLARSEAEVAGVLAHAMSHVILRHGTARVSKAYLSKAGIGALGGLMGKTNPAARIVNTVGGFGTSGAFLRFGRSDEYEADALGAELMAAAGYDPVAMASVFTNLRREKGRYPGLASFFASHPAPADRETRIRNLSNVLGHGGGQAIVGGFYSIRSRGTSVATSSPQVITATGTVEPESMRVATDVAAPSSRFNRFSHPDAILAIDHPENWDAYPSGGAVSFAPAGGVVERAGGAPNLLEGVIVNYYAPFENEVDRWNNSLTRHFAPFDDRTRQRGMLEDATDDLVRQILSANSYLSAPIGSARSEEVDGARGYSVRLSGRSPLTGEVERVTVHTRALPGDQVIYMACIAPGRSASAVERACTRMVQSLRVTDAAANRQ